MNIYSNSNFINIIDSSKSSQESIMINEFYNQFFKEEKLVYMKSVQHCGKKIPVSMLKTNFREYIEDAKNDIFSKVDDEPNEKWFVKQFLQKEGILAVEKCGGAFTTIVGSEVNSGLFSEESDIKTQQGYDVGVLIIVDSDLENFGVNIDALVHHEYYHAMYQKGIIEDNIKSVLEGISSSGLVFEVDPEEEKSADNFAEKETGHRINTLRIFSEYLPSHGMSRIKSIITGISTLIYEKRHF